MKSIQVFLPAGDLDFFLNEGDLDLDFDMDLDLELCLVLVLPLLPSRLRRSDEVVLVLGAAPATTKCWLALECDFLWFLIPRDF